MGSILQILPAILGLSGLFGGSGNSGTGPLNSLFQDPSKAADLNAMLFGNDARSIPYIDPSTGQVVFQGGAGASAPGMLGLQYAQMLQNYPLQSAITRLAGSLLPTSAGFNGGTLKGAYAGGLPGSTQINYDTNPPPVTPNIPSLGGGGNPNRNGGPGGGGVAGGIAGGNRGGAVSVAAMPFAGATPSLASLLQQLG